MDKKRGLGICQCTLRGGGGVRELPVDVNRGRGFRELPVDVKMIRGSRELPVDV